MAGSQKLLIILLIITTFDSFERIKISLDVVAFRHKARSNCHNGSCLLHHDSFGQLTPTKLHSLIQNFATQPLPLKMRAPKITYEAAQKKTINPDAHLMQFTDITAPLHNTKSIESPSNSSGFEQNSEPTSTIPSFNAVDERNWNYKSHGADWDMGMCQIGKRQSPVDLHLGDLPEPDYKNLTKLFFAAFGDKKQGEVPQPFKPWKKGDFFFSYTNLFKEIKVYKSDKVFQIRAPEEGLIPLGAFFATDTAEMYVAHQIFFHSPSEHTFQGTGNRRQIEMQIWHYSNDLLSLKAAVDTNTLTFPYFTLFTQGSLGEQSVIDDLMKQEVKGNDVNNPYGHWRVVSLTFMSEELDKTTEKELAELPSENFLKTILTAAFVRPQNKYGQGQTVTLENPMNLPSLMLMLQLTNTEFFAYDGSNTMPSCTENIRWYVARQPLPVATETMLRFYKMLNPNVAKSLDEKDGNFRELQNVAPNKKNEGKVFLVQGFPIQVLIASTLGIEDPALAASGTNEQSNTFIFWTVSAVIINCVLFFTFL